MFPRWLDGLCCLDSVTIFAFKFVKRVTFLTDIFLCVQIKTQQGVCENVHSLEVYRLRQIDDVQTAAERAVRDFIKSSGGDS